MATCNAKILAWLFGRLLAAWGDWETERTERQDASSCTCRHLGESVLSALQVRIHTQVPNLAGPWYGSVLFTDTSSNPNTTLGTQEKRTASKTAHCIIEQQTFPLSCLNRQTMDPQCSPTRHETRLNNNSAEGLLTAWASFLVDTWSLLFSLISIHFFFSFFLSHCRSPKPDGGTVQFSLLYNK